MSIASEITRLQGVKSDILQAISDKGVTVPVGSALDDCPDLIASISSGGSYADLSNYQICLYAENTVDDGNGFGLFSADERNALDFSKEVTFSFFIPAGYYSGGGTRHLFMFNSDYPNPNRVFGMDLEVTRQGLCFSFSLPSPPGLGGNPKAKILRQPIDPSFVEGVVSTCRIIGDTLNFNGVDYHIPNYSSVDLNARPNYFYIMSQGNMIGSRFYGLDVVGGNLKIRPAKRISDNSVCLVNMFTANAVTNSNYTLGPVNPTP